MKKSEFDLVVKWIKEADKASPYSVLDWCISDELLDEFIELAKRGYEEVLNDRVSEWHNSDNTETRPLHEYLGMTKEEYADWLKPKGLI